MPGKMDSFKALSAHDKRHAVVNWLLDHAMIIIILLLAVYVQIQRPQFFGVPSLVNIVSLTAARLPMALGVAGCIVLAGTDLTGGRVAGLTAFVAAILLQKAGANGRFIADGVPQNLLLVVLLVMVIGACIGFVNGFVMAKWKLHPYIITLAMQMITYGIYLTVSNSKQVSSLDPSYTTSFVTKSFVKFGTTSVPMYVVLAIFVTAIMWVVWNKTTFGKNMFAVGSNEEAARVSGVNVMATIIGVFMLAGALYGYTGFVEAARLGSSTATLGLNYEADAISAAVIGGVSFVGGTGKISGVILGVFMMQLIISGMTFLGISGNITYIIKGAVILIACILDMRKNMTRKSFYKRNKSLLMCNRQAFSANFNQSERRMCMAEENKAPQSEDKQEAKKDGVRHNWVTDIYDKMDISVRTLDIALVVLCAIVVFCFIYGAKH